MYIYIYVYIYACIFVYIYSSVFRCQHWYPSRSFLALMIWHMTLALADVRICTYNHVQIHIHIHIYMHFYQQNIFIYMNI